MDDLHLTDGVVARYWSKVDRRESDECWPWLGWKTKDGYGRLDVGKAKPLATRIALTLDSRPRPAPDQFALHGDCSEPSCCNPAHLRWGTKLENADDRDRLRRRVRVARGEANGNSRLTEDIVREILTSPLSQRAIGRKLGLTQAAVSAIRRRKTWKHVAV